MKNNRKLNKLLFILDGYPIGNSTSCVFVRNLIIALTKLDVVCTVITPQIFKGKKSIPYYQEEITENGSLISIYSPYYLHFTSYPLTLKYSMQSHTNSVIKTIEREKISFDAIYGHFIYQCGLTAAKIGKMYHVPSFLGAGESDKLLPHSTRNRSAYVTGMKQCGWKEILATVSGVISVSEWTKKLLIDGGFITNENLIGVFPNGVDTSVFTTCDKMLRRKQLNIDPKCFLLVYVGAFNENKGYKRVCEAIKLDSLNSINSVFIGRQDDGIPDCQSIVFCGRCNNERVAQYLQAADCFVLPTRSEGCCNAILEALSCGLPVISSDRPFNDGILDETNSIRINPDDITEIYDAIITLKNDEERRNKLSIGAKQSASRFDISLRAKRVLEFMNEHL